MEQNPTNSKDKFILLATAIAGAVTVSSSSGYFDFTDTAIGIILFLIVWPSFSILNTIYEKVLTSTVMGLCLLLIFGVCVEICGPHIWPSSKHQSLHFLVWLIASILCFVYFVVRKSLKSV